jgi:hypothetical protein
MAKKFVARCRVMRNGKRVLDMKNFKWGEEVYRTSIMTMDGPGSVDLPDKPAFSLDYVLPRENAKISWKDVENETWVIELDGGRRGIFSGVDSIKRGEMSMDGEKETVITFDFAATSVTIQ